MAPPALPAASSSLRAPIRAAPRRTVRAAAPTAGALPWRRLGSFLPAAPAAEQQQRVELSQEQQHAQDGVAEQVGGSAASAPSSTLDGVEGAIYRDKAANTPRGNAAATTACALSGCMHTAAAPFDAPAPPPRARQATLGQQLRERAAGMAAVLPLASTSFTSSQGELYYGLAKAVDVSGGERARGVRACQASSGRAHLARSGGGVGGTCCSGRAGGLASQQATGGTPAAQATYSHTPFAHPPAFRSTWSS